MKTHILKDIHSESRRLRIPTFNLLRQHSITIDQQAAMLQVKLPAMGKLLSEYRNLTISSYRLVCLLFERYGQSKSMGKYPSEELRRTFESQESSGHITLSKTAHF
jgi:hypothetical protein